MISFVVKTCTSCGLLDDTICSIDNVLASYGKNGWQNISLLTSKPTPYVKMRQLMYYKEILSNLRWNQEFYCPYGMDKIVARAKQLTAGEATIAKRWILPTYTTTTTTTTTTTSTTSTTTTTTTHTTTTTSTTSTTSTSTSSTTTTTTSTAGPSTWSFTVSSGLSGTFNIVVNGTTVVNQTTSGSGILNLHPGDQFSASLANSVPSTICIIKTPPGTPTCTTGDFGKSISIGLTTVIANTSYNVTGIVEPKTTSTTTTTTTSTTSTTTTTTTTP